MDLRSLKQRVIARIMELRRQGYYVAIIWDVDHVLIDGRSDDIFAIVGDLDKYFAYEEKMLLTVAYEGPWTELAVQCGNLHDAQYIVTARSTFTTPRVSLFALDRGIRASFHYSVGSQSKGPSYRQIIKEVLKVHPKSFFFMVDDSERHVTDFRAVAEELGITETTEAIEAPRIRHYSPEELKAHYDAVMDESRKEPFILTEGKVLGIDGPRYTFLVAPRGTEEWRRLQRKAQDEASERAIVESCRDELTKLAKAEFPERVVTDEFLLEIWRLRSR